MNVYIVCTGERGEGHSPVAAFTTLQVARRWVFRTYGPTLVDEPGWPGYWLWSRVNGVDLVAISRQRVQRSMS